MNRRDFLRASSLSAMVVGAGSVMPTLAGAEEVTPQLASPPMLQNPSPDGITVVWAVNGLCTGWVEYGESEGLGQRSNGSVQGLMPMDARVLKIRLTGLRPGTRYFYRVHVCPVTFRNAYDIRRGEAAVSPVYDFRTPDPGGDTTRFCVINDTHEVRETLLGLGSIIQAEPADALIWNGDIFNDIRSEEQIAAQVLAPAGQALAARVPLLPVRGNHDVRGVGARLLDRYLDLPSGLWYYTFRQGPVAFLVLDTGEDKPDEAAVYAGLNDFAQFRTEQQRWLRQAIQQPEFRSAAFRVVLMHIPLIWKDYTQAGWFCQDARAKWHDLLVEGKVNVVLSGHTHEPAWFEPGAEAPYAQLIGGGPKPEAATLIRGVASRQELQLTMLNLQGRELGVYTIKG